VVCTLWSHRSTEVQADAGCLSCHRGIEAASASHEGCVSATAEDGGGDQGRAQGIYGS
jgi:hypothetical protein